MIIVRTSSVAETHALAEALARRVCAEIEAGALEWVVIGLTGELGAGKTEFVRGFMAELGAAEQVRSPTYAIMHLYDVEPPVRHLDLYRLHSLEDLEAIGYRDYYFARGVTLVEWPETIADAIPETWLEIELAVGPTDVREIRILPHGDQLARLLRDLSP